MSHEFALRSRIRIARNILARKSEYVGHSLETFFKQRTTTAIRLNWLPSLR